MPPLNEALTSGHDTIVLATPGPGRKWYICGVGKHCAAGGMKLFINVNTDSPAPSPAPSPVRASKDFLVGDNKGWTINFDYQAWAKKGRF